MRIYLLALIGTILALCFCGTAAADPAPCTSTVSSTSALASAAATAPAGSVVCLADGSYGGLTLSSNTAGVTLQAAHAGQATIGHVSVSGAGYTLAQFKINGGVTSWPGANRLTVSHNYITAPNNFGFEMATDNDPTINDVSVMYNVFDGPMSEDQIRANGYHDANGDGYGLRIEGNEFKGNVERGDHNDVFQSVWGGDHLVFKRNYLHDFGGQGFFVKDQPTAIDGLDASDNLIVDQNLPCNPTSICPTWQLSPFQVFGPVKNVSMQHNTVGWGSTDSNGPGTAVLTGSFSSTDFSHNVFRVLSLTNSGGSVPTIPGSDNTACTSNGWGWPQGTTTDCSPAFLSPLTHDYRMANGRGVDWVPGNWVTGPETGTSPPPPADTTPPDTTITSQPSDSTSTSASFSFTATETGSTFACSLDGGAYGACTSPKSYAGLSVGGHTFAVRATDAAGNTDPTPATASWTIQSAADDDGDGVPNVSDACPQLAGSRSDGCPDPTETIALADSRDAWKARAQTAEAQVADLQAQVDALKAKLDQIHTLSAP